MREFKTAKGVFFVEEERCANARIVNSLPIYETNMRNFSITNQVAFRRISVDDQRGFNRLTALGVQFQKSLTGCTMIKYTKQFRE